MEKSASTLMPRNSDTLIGYSSHSFIFFQFELKIGLRKYLRYLDFTIIETKNQALFERNPVIYRRRTIFALVRKGVITMLMRRSAGKKQSKRNANSKSFRPTARLRLTKQVDSIQGLGIRHSRSRTFSHSA
jgi:hypothetical protein